MVGFLIAALSGALMSIQGVFNTQVTKQSGMWLASMFVQLTAFLVCLGAWMIKERTPIQSLLTVQPKYMLLGGVIGAFITVTVIQAMNSLGPAKAVLCIVVVQILVAYLIELMGLFGVDRQPFEWRKAIGMAIALVGLLIFKWK